MSSKKDAETRILLALIAAGALLRMLGIEHMEWKGDEQDVARQLITLWDRPYSPLAGVSYHSGIAHSSGFLHWLKVLSLGSEDPVRIGLGVALFNALAIGIGAWLVRGSKLGLLWIAMCATSPLLILHSRKIWAPDLMAPWVILSMALLIRARGDGFKDRKLLFASAALAPIAGHMYLPGVVAGVSLTGVAGALLWRKRAEARAWIAGSLLGWLTFVPYVIALIAGPDSPAGAARHFSFTQVWPILKALITLPSPYPVYVSYLQWISDWMHRNRPSLTYQHTELYIFAATGLWVILFGMAAIRTWRNRAFVTRDVLLVPSLAMLALNPLALLFMRLGTYAHYWLSVVPAAFYLIAWVSSLDPRSPKGLREKSVIVGCVFSLVVAILFSRLVIQNGGLPGEYGKSYAAQTRIQ